MGRFQGAVAIMLALAFVLQACAGGRTVPHETSTVDLSPVATESSGTLRVTPTGVLESAALTLDDLPAGATIITPLNCTGGGAPPTASAIVPERVCRTAFRLPNEAAVSYGSYLFADEHTAASLAPLLAGGFGTPKNATRSIPPVPEDLMATAALLVSAVGDTQQFSEFVTFARGRIVLFISVVALQDPTQMTSDLARAADRRARALFGG